MIRTLFRFSVIHTCTLVIMRNDSVFMPCGKLTVMFVLRFTLFVDLLNIHLEN
jgi:hypothetical protein